MPLKFTLFGLEFAFLGFKFTLLLKFFIVFTLALVFKIFINLAFQSS